MTDIHSPEIRSKNMSCIRSSDTKPELIVRKYLHRNGFRYRLHVKNLPGKPDLVLKKYNTVIFINGCFWHGHDGCNYYKIPKTRTDWWVSKINRTRQNDKEVETKLTKLGWNIIIIWECSLKPNIRKSTLDELINNLNET
jgi:DNA mismatch endonuclease, patch repair protein